MRMSNVVAVVLGLLSLLVCVVMATGTPHYTRESSNISTTFPCHSLVEPARFSTNRDGSVFVDPACAEPRQNRAVLALLAGVFATGLLVAGTRMNTRQVLAEYDAERPSPEALQARADLLAERQGALRQDAATKLAAARERARAKAAAAEEESR